MAVLDLQAEIWRRALDLPVGHESDALILEGTWWREKATDLLIDTWGLVAFGDE